MKPWTKDIPDQLALASVVAGASISCGERIGLIIVDNAVECMMVAYVEAHQRLVGKAISKKEWTEKKRHFEPLLEFVLTHCALLSSYRRDILHFHEIRNSLYHTGQPVSAKKEKVEEYLGIALKCFGMLFGVPLTDEELKINKSTICSALRQQAQSEISPRLSFEKSDGFVRLLGGTTLNNPDAICVMLYGFGKELGRAPTFNELLQSLRASGFPLTPEILSVRLSELRTKGRVRRKELSVSSPGRKYVVENFLVS